MIPVRESVVLTPPTQEPTITLPAPAEPEDHWYNDQRIQLAILGASLVVIGAVALGILFSPIGAGVTGLGFLLLTGCAIVSVVFGGICLLPIIWRSIPLLQIPLRTRSEIEIRADESACAAIRQHGKNITTRHIIHGFQNPIDPEKIHTMLVDLPNDFSHANYREALQFLTKLFMPHEEDDKENPPSLPFMHPGFTIEKWKNYVSNMTIYPNDTRNQEEISRLSSQEIAMYFPTVFNHLSQAPKQYIILLHLMQKNYRSLGMTDIDDVINHYLLPIMSAALPSEQRDKANKKLKLIAWEIVHLADKIFPEEYQQLQMAFAEKAV